MAPGWPARIARQSGGQQLGWPLPGRGKTGWQAALWRAARSAVAAEEAAAASPWVRSDAMARLEAVLLLAGEPLGARKLSQLANLADGTEARTLIRRLNQCYDAAGTSFRAEEVAGGFQLLTRRRLAGWLRRLHQSPLETRLSSPALETLAVVAYRQPVLRADVEAIRGVQCGEMLRQLMERDLVRIAGRSGELGRPLLYGTTKRFLQVFGLRHLDELPRAETLRPGCGETAAAEDMTRTKSGSGRNEELPVPQEAKEESHVKISARFELTTDEALEERRLPLYEPLRAASEEGEEWEEDDEEDFDDEEDEEEEEEEWDDEDFDDDWEEVDEDEAEEEEEEEEWEEEEEEEWEDEEEDEDEDWEEEAD